MKVFLSLIVMFLSGCACSKEMGSGVTNSETKFPEVRYDGSPLPEIKFFGIDDTEEIVDLEFDSEFYKSEHPIKEDGINY
ncbi:hypothetical protein JIN85_15635 [Luteolibacter pohnpeiensis]|uniref:Uncharacterized protein n=1 Tax=Luteolibacter pohnpeiensis TaxID=454153 RepID=A0A934VXU4_9BACT|nr:hypothetical protein [Luteolibacter pohnpeiensis]MBK1883849.1 hypothetical protein [Luteolibacter pohnpeiensis]